MRSVLTLVTALNLPNVRQETTGAFAFAMLDTLETHMELDAHQVSLKNESLNCLVKMLHYKCIVLQSQKHLSLSVGLMLTAQASMLAYTEEVTQLASTHAWNSDPVPTTHTAK